MAQPNPAGNTVRDRLKNRAGLGAAPAAPIMYGTADGVALDQGTAESWRQNRGFNRSLGAAAPAVPPAPAAPRGVGGRAAGGLARLGARSAGPLAVVGEIPRVMDEAEANPGVEGATKAVAGGMTRAAAMGVGAQVGGALGTAALGPYGGLAGTVIGGGVGYVGGDKAVEAMSDANSGVRRSMAQYGTERPLPVAPGGGMFMSPSQLRAGQAAGIQPDAWSRPSVNIIENGESLPDSVLGPARPARASSRTRRGGALLADEHGGMTRGISGTDDGTGALQSRAGFQRKPMLADPEATPDYLPQIDPGQPDGAQIMRSRTQGAVIENPHAMSAMDQLNFASKRFKGSPSMRRAAADLILGGEQRKDANRQAELDANNATNTTIMNSDALAREEFNERRFRAGVANAKLSEDRRAGDLNRQVVREGNLLSSAARVGAFRDKGEGDGESAFSDQVFKAALRDHGVEGAARLAAQMGNLSGELGENPYDRYAQTDDMLGVAAGVGRYGDRVLGFTDPNFDVATATPTDSSMWERLWNPSDPSGLSRFWNPSDVRFEDAKGTRAWGDAASLPRGQTQETYSIQRQMQEERRRRAAVAEAQRQGAK